MAHRETRQRRSRADAARDLVRGLRDSKKRSEQFQVRRAAGRARGRAVATPRSRLAAISVAERSPRLRSLAAGGGG